jgi:hypothetical protein
MPAKPANARNGAQGRLLVLVALLGSALGLASCGGGWIGDILPHAVGGLPKDAPPRPGAPGYEEWLQKIYGHPPKEPGEKSAATSASNSPASGK